jgi:Holliday junction resolvase RusA-like endonuclease
MDAISFPIPGEPVAKGRPRSFVRGGRVGHYTPEKTARYENLVKLAAQQVFDAPLEGGIALVVRAFMGIPRSWSQKKKDAAFREEITPTKRPDLDNIIKALKDGLNGVAWKDDAQVVDVAASKRYASVPCVKVHVYSV